MDKVTRRTALSGIAALAALAGAASAEQGQTVTVTRNAVSIASLHRSLVEDLRKQLGRTPLASLQGGRIVVNNFLPPGLFPGSQRELLLRLLEIIFNTKLSIEEMRQALEELAREALKQGNELVQAVFRIAQDSFDYAAKNVDGPTTARIAAVAGADVVGGLGGMVAATQAGLVHPAIVGLGFLSGAVSGSVMAWDQLLAEKPAK